MRIPQISQYFPSEMNTPSARPCDLARNRVRVGDEISVLTAFTHHLVGMKAPDGRGAIARREACTGSMWFERTRALPSKGAFQ